ncbi:MAG: VOC family protein, partial [Vicinamibacterales bacterium]
VGRMAHLQDPQGAAFAVSSQEERWPYREPQFGDFSWHELLTTNLQTAFDFYARLFGWEKMQTMDMGPQGIYQIFGTGGHQLGGMFNPGGLPGGPLWIPYVMVADARRTAEATKEAGGTIAHPPAEVPGGDWVFTAVDPIGAMFGAHSKKRIAPKEAPTRKVAKTAKTANGTMTKKATKVKTPKPARSARPQASRPKTAKKRR